MNHGLTLIELLVVVAMIGILAAVLLAVMNPLEQIKKTRDLQRKNDLSQIQKSLQLYFEDKGRFPAYLNLIESTTYMGKIPKDPIDSRGNYCYQSESTGKSYRLYAKLERCSDPKIITSTTCNPEDYNYTVTSDNTDDVAFDSYTGCNFSP